MTKIGDFCLDFFTVEKEKLGKCKNLLLKSATGKNLSKIIKSNRFRGEKNIFFCGCAKVKL